MSPAATNQRRVRDVMATDPHSIDGLANIDEAMRLMREQGVSSLIVTRRDSDDETQMLPLTTRGLSASRVAA